ncbi:DUF1753-domain-containing protein [Mollisia scopiformis]|uniref:DUF1753-domain-containing protein n=1 Tax=Mollisia scopiformis TaxID=149040 RepID=A0A194X8X4_MOLSC|nr:DUF1753-domain-containing protein [Mollisia scopiformis]KUJ16237.1 DUF1753-domain-containing protein [Mollisia scopiformis]
MGFRSRYLRIPRPRAFLYVMSLRTGTELISLSMIFNKVTGFYGLLAVLTGFSLSPLQLSMYMYSVAALILLAILMPHIRKQSPFQCLALAWFYLIDTIVNTAFTAAFAVTWFLAISADATNRPLPNSPGSGTIGDTAGFTDPKYNVSQVDVIATPAAGVAAGQEAVAVGVAATAAAAGSPSLAHGVGIEESIPSIIAVVFFTLIRVYFILVVMAYARQVLRGHLQAASSAKLHVHTDGSVESRADNPFAEGTQAGAGWRGKLGRLMVNIGENYWLGGSPDDEWVKGLDGRFNIKKTSSGPPGTLERERRARSGTGPPKPPANLSKV